MFESALITKLADDNILADILTEYSSAPAIFSDLAPEDAEMPYVVIRIIRSANECPAIQEFTVYVDYFDYDKSAADSRKAAERIELLLDRAHLEHARYKTIRIFFFAGSPVIEPDPRAIHYNLQFSARAGRINFCDYVSTTEGD
jgi:hypothetical protein